MTDVCICLIESKRKRDAKFEKKEEIGIVFLHRVLAVQTREFSLPVTSKTAQRGDIGLVEA